MNGTSRNNYPVLKVFERNRLIGLPLKVEERLTAFDKLVEGTELIMLHRKPIKGYYEIEYKVVINAL